MATEPRKDVMDGGFKPGDSVLTPTGGGRVVAEQFREDGICVVLVDHGNDLIQPWPASHVTRAEAAESAVTRRRGRAEPAPDKEE